MFITYFLKASGVLPYLMLTGRLYARVTGAFPKHLLLYVTPHVCCMVSSASELGLGDLVR